MPAKIKGTDAIIVSSNFESTLDTHFTNKFNTHIAAADVGSNVIEYIAGECDGSTVSTSNGDITFPNVTAGADITTTYADFSGSVISYQPPANATKVIYRFQPYMSFYNTNGISHARLYFDGNEIVYARSTQCASYMQRLESFEWVFHITGTTDYNTGNLASWDSAKTLKWQIREYSSSNQVRIHQTYWWDGTGGNQFHRPKLEIIAMKDA
jgi:hypothetical protein